MAELSEQQGHLKSILSQQQELANEINQLQAQITSKKELFQKTTPIKSIHFHHNLENWAFSKK